MWQRLGLNPYEEWIEEKEGRRRILSLSGVFYETSPPSLRFGRIGNESDLEKVAQSLSFAHVLKSFKSLRSAFDVYAPACSYPEFKTLVERHMAQRVWRAYRMNKWSDDLPDNTSTLLRFGLNPWPLAVEVGFAKRYGFAALSDVSRRTSEWVSLKSGVPLSFPQTTVYLPKDILPSPSSWEEWVGTPPQPQKNVFWSSHYHPFSQPTLTTGYVDPLMNQALSSSMEGVLPSVLRSFAEDHNLEESLSDDQLDAVWMAYRQMKEGKPFLLGDDTGYGKGRVLASICKIALKENIQVLFVTEKKDLFSDFYRDCLAVFQNDVPPFSLLHAQGKVFDLSGNRIKVPVVKIPKDEQWIWTTYSQFNRNSEDKTKSMLSWTGKKKTWVVLDEAHNASGQSNTFEAFSKFIKKSSSVIFSSATFAKQESHLQVYRSMFSGSAEEWKRLKNSFQHSLGSRTALTLTWAEEGKYIKRTHPPMSPPKPLWVKPENTALEAFSFWWQKMYILASAWGKLHRESPWKRIGAPLARAQREFSLLQKLPHLIEEVKKAVRKNQKPVIVSDWTLSSHMSRLIQQKGSSSEKDIDENAEEEISLSASQRISFPSVPLWKESWLLVLEDIFPSSECFTPQLAEARRAAATAILALPSWSASPFDALQLALSEEGLSLGEISGRNWKLTQNEGVWCVSGRDASSRIKTIRDFNDGNLDAVLLTRAGNSGTSLHASKTFADQRQRHLMEWDISPDPSVRLQFWGRVRRKDQVCEPERSSLLEDSFYGRRRFRMDSLKQSKLMAHGGTWQDDEKLHLWSKILATEWARISPAAAKIIMPKGDDNLDTLLARGLILKDRDKEALSEIIDKGFPLMQSLEEHLDVFDIPSRARRKMWWWGNSSNEMIWHERFFGMSAAPGQEKPAVALQKSSRTSAPQDLLSLKGWESVAPGSGIMVDDPRTGARTHALIIDFSHGASLATHSVTLWLATWEKPLTTSVLALVHRKVLNGEWVSEWANPTWFNAPEFPVQSLVLTGPAWQVAAWGERHAPSGSLMRLVDTDTGHSLWGWRMPQKTTFDDITVHRRELQDAKHAMSFFSSFPNEKIEVVFGDVPDMTLHSQSDGVMMHIPFASWQEKISFPLRRLLPRPHQDATGHIVLVPWSLSMRVFLSLQQEGGSFNVSSSFASYLQKNWPQK